MPAMQTGTPFRPKLIAASVAACFAVSPVVVLANPTGPSVVAGSASFARAGNQLTVVNSANAIIQWRGFSIGVNEITRFLQSSAGSAVLNRVVGAGGAIPQSVIDGVLASNGRVFLLNPAGIVIGPTGRIDVAGFFASSLALSDDDFLHGRMNFAAVPGAGDVVNGGVIQTQSAGRVYLVAPNVENSGVIRAPGGQIVLAAGKSVELASADSPGMTVQVTANGGQALNLGSLIADSGSIGMFGALVRNAGVAEANAAVVGPGGHIRFVASRDVTLDAGSRTSANGTSGGNVVLQAQGGTNLIGGTVEATGSAGQGGSVQALGLRVGVIGNGVIDASGAAGGGSVLVGGDAQGANPDVQNAQSTYIGPDGVIRADAGATGGGGRVIVWSDGDTGFYGSISARGGSRSGDGGYVETSGKTLQAFGSVDVGASNGTGGVWLLDPDNVDIVATSPASDDPVFLAYGGIFDTSLVGANSQISAAAIASAMSSSGSVSVHATQDVNLATSVDTSAYGGSLALRADRDINLGSYTIATQGNLSLTAAYGGGTGSITSAIAGGATQLMSNGGSVTLSGSAIGVGGVTTGGGSFAATASSGAIVAGALDTSSPTYSGGNATLSAVYGAVTAADITTGGSSVSVTAGGDVALGNIDTGYQSYAGNVTASTTGGSITAGSINSALPMPNGYGGGGSVDLSATNAVTTGTVTAGYGVSMQAGTGDVTTGALSAGYYGGSGIALQTVSGRIVVNGNIDAHGMSADATSSFVLDGENAGLVSLYRTDTTTDPAGGVAVQVNGSILAGGGNGYPASSSSYFTTSGSGGAGGDVLIGAGGGGTLRGAVNVTGTIDTHGGDGAAGMASSSGVAGSGGMAGTVELYATGAVTVGAVSTYGGAGGVGATASSSSYGGAGADGGYVYLTGASVGTGAIDAHGGAGGAGGATDGSSVPDGGLGGMGAGGSGYGVQLTAASGAVSTGAIDTSGGAGGDGATSGAVLGTGGAGGDGGPVSVSASGNSVTLGGTVLTAGGAGGAGGVAAGSAGADASWDITAASVAISADSYAFMALGSVLANSFEFDPVGIPSLTLTQSSFGPVSTVPTVEFGNGSTTAALALSGAIDLGSTSITTLSLDTSGAITQDNSLAVADLDADGGSVTLTSASNSVANLQGSSTGDFAFTDAGALNLTGLSVAGTATLTAGGALTQSAALSAATLGVTAPSVTLTNASNSVTNLQAQASAGNFGFTSAGALNLAGVSASGTITIAAGGAVTQSAPVSGALSVSTSAGGITLTEAANRIPSLNASAPGNVAVVNGTAGTLMNVQSASGSNVSLVSDQVIFSGPVSGGASVEFYTANDQPIGVTPSFFNNVTTPLMKLGNSAMTADIALAGAIAPAGVGALSLITGGQIYQSSASDSISVAALNADGGSVALPGANSVGTLQARAKAGDVFYNGAGSIGLGTADPGNPVPGVSATGLATLVSGGDITGGMAGSFAVRGGGVVLHAAGAIGAPGAPLEAGTTSLAASAANGITLDLNQFAPAYAAATLSNGAAGDITLNAWGGVQTTSLVDNAGGNVAIRTHSPLDVLAGISAAQGISLETTGNPSNDVYLDYGFSQGTGYAFNVTLGPLGVLTLGPNFSGTISNQSGGDPLANPQILLAFGTQLNALIGTNAFGPYSGVPPGAGGGQENGNGEEGYACR